MKMNESWEEEFDKLFLSVPEKYLDNKLAVKLFPVLRDYGEEVKRFIHKVIEEERKKWIINK